MTLEPGRVAALGVSRWGEAWAAARGREPSPPVMGGASPVPGCRSGWLCPVMASSAPLSVPCVCPGSDNSLQLCVLAPGLCVHLPDYILPTEMLPARAWTVSSVKQASSS